MFDLPAAMLSVLSIFLPLFFSNPSYMNFLELFQGHILCKGKRTISEILKSLGLRNVKNYSRYHDFFRKAKWSTLKGAEILLLYIVALIPKKITIIADSAFANYILANICIDLGITLVSRMRLDARTFEFSEKPKRGRQKLVGKRLPTFKMILEDPSRIWDTIEILWYGGRKKKIDILTGTCLWYAYGIRPVPIKWVLTRDSNVCGLCGSLVRLITNLKSFHKQDSKCQDNHMSAGVELSFAIFP